MILPRNVWRITGGVYGEVGSGSWMVLHWHVYLLRSPMEQALYHYGVPQIVMKDHHLWYECLYTTPTLPASTELWTGKK